MTITSKLGENSKERFKHNRVLIGSERAIAIEVARSTPAVSKTCKLAAFPYK